MYYLTYIHTHNEPNLSVAQLFRRLYTGQEPAPLREYRPDTYPHTRTIEIGKGATVPPIDVRHLDDINELARRTRTFKEIFPDPEQWYETFYIPKHSGGMRRIDAPIEALKIIQRDILQTLTHVHNQRYPVVLAHDCAYAYINKRSALEAMQKHQANHSNWFLKLDIKDFFPSCTKNFVRATLANIYPFMRLPDVALLEILNVCFWHNTLPQGAVTSPFLSNMVMVPYDKAISDLTYHYPDGHHYIYTRYADDILLSAREDYGWNTMVSELETIFKDTPFRINRDKTRYGSKAGRNWNLGMMLNKDNNLTVGHKQKQRMRAAVHNLLADFSKGITWSNHDAQVLQGQLAYMDRVEPGSLVQTIKPAEEKYHLAYHAVMKEIFNP